MGCASTTHAAYTSVEKKKKKRTKEIRLFRVVVALAAILDQMKNTEI
jgi:hypothetical protein